MHALYCISQSSWRRQLRTKFKNLRRPDRASKAGIVVPPPPQKPKTAASTGISEYSKEPSSSLVAEYERHIQFPQRSYASKNWSVSIMITLMEQTADMRREWVQKHEPSVSQCMSVNPNIGIFPFPRHLPIYIPNLGHQLKFYPKDKLHVHACNHRHLHPPMTSQP